MSEQTERPSEEAKIHGRTMAEEDVVPTRKIVAVGIGALAIFFVGCLVMAFQLGAVREAGQPEGPPPLPPEAGQAKIGMVEQVMFENQVRPRQMLEDQRRQLGQYGWVDRKAGTVRIPIDQAMNLFLKGVRP